MTAAVVAIMAKTPRAGSVKTRLCPPLTADEAAGLYRCFLLDKIEQVRGLGCAQAAIAYTPADGRREFEALAPDFLLVDQREGDLGARLGQSFASLFASGYAAALVIDSDTPTLPTSILRDAVRLIRTSGVDVVVGPTEDGGYYLVGLQAPQPELFRDVAWSTSAVLGETIRRAKAKGLTIACLPSWFDVDTPADLEQLTKARSGSGVARHTHGFLAALRGGA
jgi:rSAM/selenodomain-associated transferase 1